MYFIIIDNYRYYNVICDFYIFWIRLYIKYENFQYFIQQARTQRGRGGGQNFSRNKHQNFIKNNVVIN